MENAKLSFLSNASLIERQQSRLPEISWGRSGEREVLRGLGMISRKAKNLFG